jgi:hypothetical protein
VNIWATRAGLTHISALNFKLQAHVEPKENLSRAKLQHLNYNVRELENGARIYARARSKSEKRAQRGQNGNAEGDLLQAVYEDSAAIGEVSGDEESSSAAALDDFQAELEQLATPVDPEYVDDVFAAHEMGDQLAKQKPPKEGEVHKKGGDKEGGGKKGTAGEKKSAKGEEAEATPTEPNAEFWQTLQEMGFSE